MLRKFARSRLPAICLVALVCVASSEAFCQFDPQGVPHCTAQDWQYAFFKSIAETPDAPVIVRVTVTKAWDLYDAIHMKKQDGINYTGRVTFGLVSVDEVIKGDVPDKALAINVSGGCRYALKVGDTGYMAGRILPRSKAFPDRPRSFEEIPGYYRKAVSKKQSEVEDDEHPPSFSVAARSR